MMQKFGLYFIDPSHSLVVVKPKLNLNVVYYY